MSKKPKNELINKEITKCVWFPEINCPVRVELEKRKLISNTIKPKKTDDMDFGSMMSSVMQTVPLDFSILPAYCGICHLRKDKLEVKV